MIPSLRDLEANLALLERQLVTRQLADGPTAAELSLQNDYAGALRGALGNLYTYPLDNGLENQFEESQRSIVEWILDLFRANPAAFASLTVVLTAFQRRGFELGGSMGLTQLGLPPSFALSDPGLLGEIDQIVVMLGTPDGRLSLIRTTARELARRISRLNIDGDLSTTGMISNLRAYGAQRAAVRAVTAASNETVRLTRQGMLAAWVHNAIEKVIFRTQGDIYVDGGDPLGPCAIREGVEYNANNVPRSAEIPIHIGCRCFYDPIVTDWEVPSTIWIGGALS